MNIDTDEDFPEHPKTLRFCAMLGNPIGWAYLWKLWRWCAKFQPDGDLTNYEPNEVELSVGWTAMDGRFFNAAVRAGFIDRDEHGSRVHNWMRRLGGGLVRMEIDRLRKATYRAKQAGDQTEASRLEALALLLKRRLDADVQRTSAGQDADVQRTSAGQDADVQRTSNGQTPNGVGQVEEIHHPADVSALLCSALLCSADLPPSALARDPGPEPVAPAPAPPPNGASVHPLLVPSPPDPARITTHDLLHRFGIRWRDKYALPWAPDRNAPSAARGLLEDQIGRMEPEARKAAMEDLFPAIDRYLTDDGRDGALLAAMHPFGWFVDRFNRYRAKPEGVLSSKKKHWMDDLTFIDPDAAPR